MFALLYGVQPKALLTTGYAFFVWVRALLPSRPVLVMRAALQTGSGFVRKTRWSLLLIARKESKK
jgi:hypothetical protein